MKWIQPIMVSCFNQQMIQGFMRCFHMSMDKSTRNNKCLIRQESEDLEIHKLLIKEPKIRPKWEILCTMETSWKTSDKVMLGNKMWTISRPNSIMEDNHLSKWITKILLKQVIEMVQAHSVSIQVALEVTESELQMVLPKIIRLIYSIWSTSVKLQMGARTNNNKWWWQPNSSSIRLKINNQCFKAWIHQVKILTKEEMVVEAIKSTKLLHKLNLESRELIVVLAIQFSNNMRTVCQLMEMLIIKTWMPLCTLIITERDLFKVVQEVISQTWMQWMLPWMSATLPEMVKAILPVETTQP